ncbi:hypothetical protein ASPWEDRAFT_71034 [Aspergillus wentii DTO 134E9]|uniref:CYTH domain-containing protein n=1 Tax=Aspergillus wentii DTO 134E9 TaxID=1073089 RepID=A0A1L9RF67_ASPWE|nr:uncharacterized protein ASPWEDRAFT_71034 [Aspergillus wentii DTO 134E9]OJJ33518.1 hypothetical protein ASPWEDRAFT_71034 [Aspergillus wentii DTO 134E9]
MKLHFLFAFLLATAPCSEGKVKNKISLQWSICDKNPQTVLQKLGEDSYDPDKLDPISYYDTHPPMYAPRGFMFRTKVRAGKEISVVKVKVNTSTTDVAHAKCLWDRYGNDTSFFCAKQSTIKGSQMWRKKQVALAENFTTVAWDELVEFGPYWNPKWKKLNITGYQADFDDVVAGSHHLMELEAKVPLNESHVAYNKITNHLKKAGVVICNPEEPKIS